ncbi:MAG TPA: hypothetical protein VK531_12085 [Gemmatimonadales bacterium]|nr:hypothetical protein [Gemmatimonadales bacterium]
MRWLATVPTTNAIIVSGIGLAWATLLASWLGWHIPDGWLLFVAAHMGISTIQFASKRLTNFKKGTDATERPGGE